MGMNLVRRGVLALVFSLCMGAGAGAGQIVVGQVAPLTGLEAAQGRSYSAGMQLYFEQVNKTGGVNGNTLLLVRKDDGGRPNETASVTRSLIQEHRPLLLAGYFGSQSVTNLVSSGLLEKEHLALVGYRSADLRPETPGLYSVRASLKDEIGKIIEHVATVGVKRLAVVHEQGPAGTLVLAVTEQAAREAGAAIVATGSYPAGTVKTGAAAQAIAQGQPQVVIVVASAAATATFVEHYKLLGGRAQIFAHSEADMEQLARQLSEEQMQGVAIAQVTPNPYKLSGALVRQLQDALQKKGDEGTPLSYAMMEGYINAKVIVEAVRRAGPRPSREAFAAALESLQQYDLGGYVVSFKPGSRTGSHYVELTIISKAGQIRQ
ncbi:ABC transporter substrate-binding protein [Variovorax terrae]|uniref:ABC transporter substrate-binding protein n=1 Tax=Variovorax terrae TaxID=2923278 RepID=A0A9X2AMV6_9BURK|nr:ABC transporter substrate-binding protein [Variovorax terrae]MCJ0761692.1 ABC transporter substrate-binding protein [Variovorax terrae]